MFGSETTILNLNLNQITFYLFTLAVTEAVCIYLWRYRDIPGAKVLFACQVTRCSWVLGHFFLRLSPDLMTAIFWGQLASFASILLAYFWCIFAMEISRQEQKMPVLVQVLLHSLAGIALLIIATNSWHAQYVTGAFIAEGKLMVFLGPGYRLVAFTAYTFVALGVLIFIRWTWITRGWRRQMALLLSFTPVFTMTGHFLHFLPAISSYSPFVIGSLLSELYSVWVFYRWRLFSILPFAQEAVVQNMIDGLLVVDEEGYIVDINPAAVQILKDLPAEVGGQFQNLMVAWPALADLDNTSDGHPGDVYRDYPYGRRHYQISVIPLQTAHKHNLGNTIIMKDITKQKQDQGEIMDQQKALAILRERNRLGREIHDGKGQIWNYMLLELQMLRALFSSGQKEAAEKQIERLSTMIRELNDDVRESIAGLKSTELENSDFVAPLQEYLKWYEKTYGIAVRLTLPEEADARILSKVGEVQLLRIMQEALTNIRKHANARNVDMVIQKQDSQVSMMIADDGCGFDSTAVFEGKYGLKIMQERAEEAGCQFCIESNPGKGTKLTLAFVEVKDDGNKEIHKDIVGR